MKQKGLRHGLMLLLVSISMAASAQEAWTVDRCMQYAVDHNHAVRQSQLELKNNSLDKLKAFGSFLPRVQGAVSAQYNYGRSIDPETNTYNDVTTFNNYYDLTASIPLFSGGSLVNEVRRANAAALMGKAALQEQKDNTALETFQDYIQALYYQGTIRMARQKLAESDSTLYKTRVQEEVGLKGAADVAQMEAQQATDAYNLTKQENLYTTAMLELKQKMNYPVDQELLLDTTLLDSGVMDNADLELLTADGVWQLAEKNNPTLQKSHYNARVQLMSLRKSWAAVMPTIAFSAGYYTSYYKQLHKEYASFADQFDHNHGSYFSFSLSIPIFNRLDAITGIKQARNSYRIAREQLDEQRTELHKLVEQAVQDRDGFLKESIQMEKKEASDALAYTVTKRKYEEGLMTSLDVQTSSATWLDSQANLLQSKLTYFMKCRLVNYYRGGEIIDRENIN